MTRPTLTLKITPNVIPGRKPRKPVDRWVNALRIEENAHGIRRKSACEKNLGQVVDEIVALGSGDALELRLFRELKKDLVRLDEVSVVVRKAQLHPFARRHMKIILRSQKWITRLVADDADRDTVRVRPTQEFGRPGIRRGFVHARAVDVTLHFRPGIFLADAAQMVAHRNLGLREGRRHDAPLDRDFMKQGVITNEGVVEINANTHDRSG